jgi:ribosomal protein S18 acetylase RimI-like enzyme
MNPPARLARATDLSGILALFEASEVSRPAEPRSRAEEIWLTMLSRAGVSVFVSEATQSIVASCMLIVAPNLLRDGRQHGFIENVVTHPDFRGRGHGSAVLAAALVRAWKEDCHHVLLQSGRADERVHAFYEKAGFVPGLRTGYVAMRPS